MAQQENVVDTIIKNGKIRVGMSSFLPWAFRDKEGEFVGFEIDVARELAKDMGVSLELVPTAWDGIIPSLISGKFDVIIGGMSISPTRNLTVNFSDPYSTSGLELASNKKVAKGMKQIKDFDNAKVTIAIRRGGSAADVAKKLFPKAKVRSFDDEASLERELINGNAHAIISSAPLPAFLQYDNPKLIDRPIKEYLYKSEEGFVLRKGDFDSLNFFNNWIRVKKNSGWLQEKHQYWFETRKWANMLPKTN